MTFPAGMMQLDKNAGIMAMDCFRQMLKTFNRIIAGKRKLVIFTCTVYIIDTRDLCDDQTGASLCPLFIKTDLTGISTPSFLHVLCICLPVGLNRSNKISPLRPDLHCHLAQAGILRECRSISWS
ncbi:MAG: hypothetical protein IJ899_18380 [Blautia sp.]|nr:hypothetical protein [Blautia sp.]